MTMMLGLLSHLLTTSIPLCIDQRPSICMCMASP